MVEYRRAISIYVVTVGKKKKKKDMLFVYFWRNTRMDP